MLHEAFSGIREITAKIIHRSLSFDSGQAFQGLWEDVPIKSVSQAGNRCSYLRHVGSVGKPT